METPGYLIGYDVKNPDSCKVIEHILEVPNYNDKINELKYYDDKMYNLECAPEERPHYKEAKDEGLTHWTFIKMSDINERGSDIFIAYDVGKHPEVDGWGDQFSADICDYVLIYNLTSKDIKNITLPRWSKRDKAASREQALEFLATFLSHRSYLSKKTKDEVEAYANKWSIPFCCDLHAACISAERKQDELNWVSSSANC